MKLQPSSRRLRQLLDETVVCRPAGERSNAIKHRHLSQGMSCVYQAWLRTVRMLTISRVEASQAWYRPRALDLTKPVYFSRCANKRKTEVNEKTETVRVKLR